MQSYRDYNCSKLNMGRRAFRNRHTESNRKLLMTNSAESNNLCHFLWVKIALQAPFKRLSSSLCIADSTVHGDDKDG